jgi:uncharacterized protein
MQILQTSLIIALVAATAPAIAAVPPKKVAPSFNCAKAKKGSIDSVICASRELSILDRTMGQDFKRADLATPRTEQPALLKEQREFIANRNLCMKQKAERHDCIAFAYESRIQRLADWIDGLAWKAQP